MHHGHYVDAVTGSRVHPSLTSDSIPKFIYKKMERHVAGMFANGSVQIGSLAYYRTITDVSGMIVDSHEGVEEFEVTKELRETSSMLFMMTNGNPPAEGMRIRNEDNRRLVFCASASAKVPARFLDPKYDTWVRIEAVPAIELIHRALLGRVSDAEGPVFKNVIYDRAIDGPDDRPPILPGALSRAMGNALQLSPRWHTKRTQYEPQREVRVGWLASPTAVGVKPIVLPVAGLQDFVKILPSKAAKKAARRAARR